MSFCFHHLYPSHKTKHNNEKRTALISRWATPQEWIQSTARSILNHINPIFPPPLHGQSRFVQIRTSGKSKLQAQNLGLKCLHHIFSDFKHVVLDIFWHMFVTLLYWVPHDCLTCWLLNCNPRFCLKAARVFCTFQEEEDFLKASSAVGSVTKTCCLRTLTKRNFSRSLAQLYVHL